MIYKLITKMPNLLYYFQYNLYCYLKIINITNNNKLITKYYLELLLYMIYIKDNSNIYKLVL